MNLRHISRLAAVGIAMLVAAGCAKSENLPDNIAKTEEKQEGSEPAADSCDEALTVKEPPHKAEEVPSSFREIFPRTGEIAWAIYSEGVYCYSDGSLWGYLSEEGEEITPCIYENAEPFSEGLACAELNGKYGYIGKDGEEAIPFRYDQAASFREGAAYYSCGEEYGLIDRNGDVIVELACDSISSFREGLAYFSVDGLYGYMDKSGKTVINPVYGDAGYFHDGLAVVMKNGLLGVIGKDGREVLSTEYINIRIEDTHIIAQQSDEACCFDKEGKKIFSGVWDDIQKEESIYYIEKDGKKGLADKNGKVILEPDYTEIVKVSEKELVIVQNESGMYGLMDYDRQVRVPFLYSYISDKEGGILFREADTEKAGFWDKDDLSVKIPAVYDSLSDFTDGRAVAGTGGKYGVVRYDGTLEMPVEYDEIRLFSDGSMYVCKETDMKLTDSEGNLILSGYGPIWKWGEGYKTDIMSDICRYWNDQGKLIAVDEHFFPDLAYGAKNSHVLGNGGLLISGEESEEDAERFLLTNQITPRAGLLSDHLKTGSLTTDTIGPEATTEIKEILRDAKGFTKLYRTEDQNLPLLYFYARPWEQLPFPMSDSGLFTVLNGQAEQVLGASECGGSMRGDEVCFWYDTKENTLKPGIKGSSGGWGGYAVYRGVYRLENGQAVLEAFFGISWEESQEKYGIRGQEAVSEEEYHEVERRYRCYLPIDFYYF